MDRAFFPAALCRRFVRGDVIFRTGDAARQMFVVRAGEVEFRQPRADGGQVVLRRAGAGEIFGEIALVEDVPRTADALVVSDTAELLEIDHAHFVYLVGQQPAFAVMVMQTLSRRLRQGENPAAPAPTTHPRPAATAAGWRQLRDRIYLLNGAPGSGGCNVYLLRGQRRNILIDTGLPVDFPYIKSHLEAIGLALDDIDLILLSHEHIDHVGAAPLFSPRTVLAAHPRAANKIGLGDNFVIGGDYFGLRPEAFHIDLQLPDETLIDLGGCRLRVLHTPGHVSGAVCFYEPEQKLLFTADTLFAGGILGGIFASGSNSDYTASLERLLSLRIDELFPGHGRASTNPHADLERGIQAARRLGEETRALFEAISHGNSFSYLFRGIADYARRVGASPPGNGKT